MFDSEQVMWFLRMWRHHFSMPLQVINPPLFIITSQMYFSPTLLRMTDLSSRCKSLLEVDSNRVSLSSLEMSWVRVLRPLRLQSCGIGCLGYCFSSLPDSSVSCRLSPDQMFLGHPHELRLLIGMDLKSINENLMESEMAGVEFQRRHTVTARES